MRKQEDNISIIGIVKKWEVLRIYFNAILVLVVFIGTFPIWNNIPDHKIYLIENIISFILANIFYSIGSFIEILFGLLKLNLSRYRLLIWISGTFFSLILALYSLRIVYSRYN